MIDPKKMHLTQDDVECFQPINSNIGVLVMKDKRVFLMVATGDSPQPIGLMIADKREELAEVIDALVHMHDEHMQDDEEAAKSTYDQLMGKIKKNLH